MFWTKRLKNAERDADGSWVLSYGDLMSLLLVIFVMISAMSELRADDRFSRMGQGVRAAFGFTEFPSSRPESTESAARPTLLERLEQTGFRRQSTVQLVGPDDEVLAPCDVIVGKTKVTIRIAGHVSFAPHSSVLDPVATRAIGRLAGYLRDGRARLEIRGHGEAESLPAAAPYRDGLDLAYARARAVSELLAASGVTRDRMWLSAWADPNPNGEEQLSSDTALTPAGTDRRIEIVVHADQADGMKD